MQFTLHEEYSQWVNPYSAPQIGVEKCKISTISTSTTIATQTVVIMECKPLSQVMVGGSLGVHQPGCQLSHLHTGSSQKPQRRVRNCKKSRKFLCQDLSSQIFRAPIGVARISFGLKNDIFCRKIHSRKIIVFDYNICLININHSQICRYIIKILDT